MFQRKPKHLSPFEGLGLCAAACFLALTIGEGSSHGVSKKPELIQVKVHNLIVDPASNQPVVLLADLDEEKALFIWIALLEARAIYSELNGLQSPRPLTHDLMEKILQQLNGKVQHVVVTRLEENVYYSVIALQKGSASYEFDARPSDAIVMALKFGAPIFVAKKLFDDMAVSIAEQIEIEEEYGLSLQDLTPALAAYLSFTSQRGVLVSDVRKGSRAAKDGIEAGDIFVEIGGQAIEDLISMKEALAKIKTLTEAKVFRKNRYIIVTLHRN